MEESQLRQHLTILGWLHLAAAGCAVLIGGFVFVVLNIIGVAIHDREATAILGIVGAAVAGFLVLLSLPGLFAGYGLLKRRPWARILAIVVGALHLYNMPLGTALGIYTFVILADAKADGLFRGAGSA
ncbi:MAG TPA: hypothetical protein DD490_20395 [Acidobacteria bacterium]|nr:hypothetical protein [Acidobacteriota bacterium]